MVVYTDSNLTTEMRGKKKVLQKSVIITSQSYPSNVLLNLGKINLIYLENYSGNFYLVTSIGLGGLSQLVVSAASSEPVWRNAIPPQSLTGSLGV